MHKLHLPVVGEYGCVFSRIFQVTKWSALLSFSFQMCSLSDGADDLCEDGSIKMAARNRPVESIAQNVSRY